MHIVAVMLHASGGGGDRDYERFIDEKMPV
jgi:hypothetical protein